MTIQQSRPAIAATGLRKPFGDQVAANGTPIRDVVGEAPVEFAEAFARNHPDDRWIIRERERLTNAIERAAGEDTGSEQRAVR
jgi:hypothetical protein